MRVVVTERAETNLERAYDYGFAEFGINAVIRLQRKVEELLWLLRSQPYIGTPEMLLADNPRRYRYLVLLGVFKLIYYVDTEKDSVIITDLWDARMNQSVLAEETLHGDKQ